MKVEFTVEEVWQMMQTVTDALLEADLDKKDRAALRSWRSGALKLHSHEMKGLTEKVNSELQRSHTRSEATPIKKPDWMS
ncbi:MAG: hypothetical protein EXR65_00595 [Dehalococcoidia bacterium]|nr:hypothetical protein [Dehalococcoidia bacterium]